MTLIMPPGISLFAYFAITAITTVSFHMTKAYFSFIGRKRKKLQIQNNKDPMLEAQSFHGEKYNILSFYIPDQEDNFIHNYEVYIKPGERLNLGSYKLNQKVTHIISARIYDADEQKYIYCTSQIQMISGPNADFFGRKSIPYDAIKDILTSEIKSGHIQYGTTNGEFHTIGIEGVKFETEKQINDSIKENSAIVQSDPHSSNKKNE